MKKPQIIEKLEIEYKSNKETAQKFNEEYNDSFYEFVRRKYKVKSSGGIFPSQGMFSKTPTYAEIKDLEEALQYLENKNSKPSIEQTIKQGSARQLAIAFHFMVQSKHLPKGTLDHAKNAEFIQFLTGKGSENIRKKLGSIKQGEVAGIGTEKEIKSLINDLTEVQNVFRSVLFMAEVKMIDLYITKLRNDLSSLEES